MNYRAFITAILLTTAAGCATPNIAVFDPTITIYHEGQKPDRPYREIGELSKEYFTGEDAVVLADFVKQAKAHGADGVIVLPGRDVGYQWNPFGRSGNRYVWRAAMIIWTQNSTPASTSTHPDAKPL